MTTPERHPMWDLLDKMQMDIRALDRRLVEFRGKFSQLDLPEDQRPKCPHCQVPCRGPLTLAEHVYVSHDGPLPAHWAALDASIVGEQLASSREEAAA